jgi:hypothetical protein
MTPFREAAEKRMQALGIASWYALAKLAQVPASTVYRCRDGGKPGIKPAWAIALALKTAPDRLWGMDEFIESWHKANTPGHGRKRKPALQWVVPEQDHKQAAALGWVPKSRSKYLRGIREYPQKFFEAYGIMPQTGVEAEIELGEILKALRRMRADPGDPAARYQAAVKVARRRGLDVE